MQVLQRYFTQTHTGSPWTIFQISNSYLDTKFTATATNKLLLPPLSSKIHLFHWLLPSPVFVPIGCTWCTLQKFWPGHWSFLSRRTFFLACLTAILSASRFATGRSCCRSAAWLEMIGSRCRARDLYSVTCLAAIGWRPFLMLRVVPPLCLRSISRAEAIRAG